MSRMNKIQRDNALMMNHFGFLHENAPAPFNPEYKPYAGKVCKLTVEFLQEQGVYEHMTLKQRQDYDVYRKRYDKVMAKYEHVHRLASH